MPLLNKDAIVRLVMLASILAVLECLVKTTFAIFISVVAARIIVENTITTIATALADQFTTS